MTTPNHGPSSHNLNPSRSPDYVDNLPDSLQIDAIEKLRAEQNDHIENLLKAAETSKGSPLDPAEEIAVRGQALSEFDDEIKKNLERNGIDSADPHFNTYAGQLRDLSIDKIDDLEWNNRPIDPNDSSNLLPSPRMKAVDDLRTLSGTIAATPPPANTLSLPQTPEQIRTQVAQLPEIIKARDEVDQLKTELAKITAKRQSRIFSKKETKEAYENAKRAYEKAVNDLAKAELQAERDGGIARTEEDERLDVSFKLIQEYQGLQKETINIMKGTTPGRFVDWMTRGGTAKRIVKGVLVGVGAGVVGAGIVAATAGTAGGAVLFGGATAAGMAKSASFAKAYARRDNELGRGAEVVEANHRMSSFNQETLNSTDAGTKSAEESVDLVHAHLMKKLDEDTKREQGKRRKSTRRALGVVAIGFGIVEAAHYAADLYSSYSPDKLNNWAPWSKDMVHAHGGGHDTDIDKPDGDHNSDKPDADAAPKEPEYSSDARTIRNGEGFFQTMEEMGIRPEDRPALLEKVGPQLHDVTGPDGQPIAFKMSNGEWGIRMTPDGKMPTEALDLIHNTHEQMIGNGSGMDASGAAESATGASAESGSGADVADTSNVDTSSSAETITDTPADPDSLNDKVNFSSIENVITKETISAGDVAGNQELTDLSHVASWYPPDAIGQKLHLSATEWAPVKEYIMSETQSGNRLYADTFDVQNGYLTFASNRIPAETMADILNHIPRGTRYDLAA